MQIIPFYLGIVAMQSVYLTYYYILSRKKDFLYYVLFTFFFTLFFSFVTVPFLQDFGNRLSNGSLFASAMTFIMLGAAMYYKFIRHFAGTVMLDPQYDKIIRITEHILVFCALLMLSNTTIFNRKIDFFYPIFRVLYFLNIVIQVYSIYVLLKSRKLLNLILAIGSIVMALLVKIAIMPIMIQLNTQRVEITTFNYVFAGLILNFLFFNFALIYKSRSIEKEKTVLQIQKQTELFNQRTEIGNDLHDDIGATLSGLHVYSTIVESEIDRNPDLAKKYLNKITIGIRTVMDNMNDVIWAVNIREKNPKLFSSRLKDFNMEIFDAKNIECIYEIDTELERKITRMIARKNLILITKEAINNVVKHSRATKVFIRLKTNGDSLILEIEDNGIGMTSHKNKSGGNGLHSLQIRTTQLGGVLSIHNHHHGGGLLVQTSIPLANISD